MPPIPTRTAVAKYCSRHSVKPMDGKHVTLSGLELFGFCLLRVESYATGCRYRSSIVRRSAKFIACITHGLFEERSMTSQV